MTRRSGALGYSVSVGAIVVVLAIVIGVVRTDQARRDADAEASASSIATAVAVDIAAGTSSARRALEVVASSASERPVEVLVSGAVPGLAAVSIIDSSGGSVTNGTLPESVVSSSEFAAAARRARDTGLGQLSAPIGTDALPVLVQPLYMVGEGLSDVPPRNSTEGRRDAIGAFLAAVIDVDTFLPRSIVTDGSVSIADGDATLASSGLVASGARSTVEVAVDARRWVVTSVVPTSSVPSAGAILLIAAFLVASITAAAIVAHQRRGRLQLEDALALERQRRGVIAEMTPMLQRSLHMSDVLPALAVQLTDRFDLLGVSVVVLAEDGAANEVFCHGTRPERRAMDVGVARPVPSETSALLTLARGGRLVAELRFLTGRELDERDVEGIHTSAELVTSAIVTAQAIDRQQAAMDQLSELDSMKNVFLTTAAHELKTPLAAMMGLADVLDSHWSQLSEEERRTMARRVAANTHALDLLVRDLLDFSRLEAGELAVDLRPVALDEIVRSVLDRQSAAWAEHSIELHVDEGPVIAADPLALERVLTNLVANAVKYSGDGSRVDVTVRHRGGFAELIVDDSGEGIDVADRERVFERFYRGNSDVVLRTRGVGIGLSVVREFVRKLDGKVRVEESPSGGARFVCRFPHQEFANAVSAPDTDGGEVS